LKIGPCVPSVTKSNCLRHRVCAAGPCFVTFPTHFILSEPVDCVQFLVFLVWSLLLPGKRLYGFVVMQQPPRLVQSGAGQRSGTAPASVPPLTPRKKGEELNDLICSLEDRYQLGFNVKAGLRSPAQRKSTADTAAQLIKFLFFSHRPALDDALATFATTATFIAKDQQANALLTVLRSKTQHGSPISRSATPKNVPPKSLKTSQLCRCASF